MTKPLRPVLANVRQAWGGSSPRLAKWLGDIRTYFKEDVVSVIQQDAIERRGLSQLLLEPELLKNVQPNVQLVGTLMSLSGQIPERTKETARMVVRAVVEQIKLQLEQQIRQAVLGALNRKQHSPIPNAGSIDWKWTISRNLKNYQPHLGSIIPKRVYFYSRAQKTNHWTVIVDMYEGGNQAQLVRRLSEMVSSGVRCLCLLALSDNGKPSYDEGLAKKLAALGIPCFACTPNRLPELLEGALRATNLTALAARLTTEA